MVGYEKKLTFMDRCEIAWFRVTEFFKNWIWPAYRWRCLLIKRYDLVRLRDISATEYCDVSERMLHAVMELVCWFMEREKPEEHVLWYQDEEGHDVGHKYGEYQDRVMFEELRGEFVMDIIKDIYNWWNYDLPQLEYERQYLLSFWCDYCSGRWYSEPCDDGLDEDDDEKMYVQRIDLSVLPKSLDYFDDKDVDWDIIDKYVDGNRENVLKENFIHNRLNRLEAEIDRQKQYYLHLAIEVRQYLWT